MQSSPDLPSLAVDFLDLIGYGGFLKSLPGFLTGPEGGSLFDLSVKVATLRSLEPLLGLTFLAPGFGTTGVELRADNGLACVFVYFRSFKADVDVAEAALTMLRAADDAVTRF